MSTRLHKFILEQNDGDEASLQVRVWAGTPWIIDTYVGDMIGGSRISDREFSILEWCRDNLGPEAQPFTPNPRAGRWRRGGATVFGWSWFGFASEQDMHAFESAWPTPDDVANTTLPMTAPASENTDG